MSQSGHVDDTQQSEMHATRMECTVEYAVQPAESGGEAPPLLLALHGWGQTCGAFLQAFQPLRARGVLVVAPQAPHPFYLNAATKQVGFSWLTRYRRDDAVADINRYLDSLLGLLAETHAFDEQRLFLLGFSQGASVAYRYALSAERPIAGLIACSADLPPDVSAKLHTSPSLRILLVHGQLDRIVPPGEMAEARKALMAAGYPVETLSFRGGHRVAPQVVERIAEWMDAHDR